LLPKIGITLGDPGGIGPEVLLKSLRKTSGRYIVFGSSKVLFYHSAKLGIPFDSSRIDLIDIDNVADPYFGAAPKISGPASIEYLERAFEFFERGMVQAIVTGPIHKESWHAAGFSYPGQTEYCAEKTGRSRFCMLMAGKKFRIALLSTHLSLQEALQHVQQEKIADQLRLIHEEFVNLDTIIRGSLALL
jgi:4-phospho-D-threonate 3-dehydrogenase / 4-phospho-D-erythronate 3-dehydrogenase